MAKIAPHVLGTHDTYDTYELEVTYDVVSGTHDGYCSDADNIKQTTSSRIIRFPLIKNFKKKDMKPDFSIDIYNDILRTYYNKPTEYKCCCKSTITYTITSAKVVEKITIVLDS
jgi:hypothetical protein